MVIHNRKAKFEYELFDHLEVGIVLTGGEVKSVSEGHVGLDDAYVKVIDGELFLVNAHIHPYEFAQEADPKRSRKLLIHKKELLALENKMQQKNLDLVPISLYFHGHKVKLEIALAKGKKEFEKKESVKKRDIERRMEEEIKE
ncbi:SsrA-binding protein [Candidatus Shapirobacteria bacterium CG08_land_8_20_14_0_20_39_18]|uniref:SsrA-binding protein n=1 Tax=Candidatus Shapirobacteria bacterium CG08_land_8_20_14_0_20_39_18 TaxID=1974883 RepID=A0A2M6XCU9_9BACT|nr:MAG: SsrA-binding protein [Candidatus Shapirobacteria bacterium CG08_land_8_20_14_0_20_39_18]PIY65143.1 MAG: SsrA-binding protein [Candidatus Shapirobacteria bacterium CG_4_10_14_0_8_um_filter_39_15]PJE68000.1 MAG: SsrA-binding protein [Candidatus Shapirobacteria bacterium CG10_big_fil_rev_8_21_14_0_10_38_8]